MPSNTNLLFEVVKLISDIICIIVRSSFKWIMPRKNKDISNDIVLITGGNKGIGKCIALEFVKYHPRHIVIWGRNKSSLEEISMGIRKLGVPCTHMTCDVSDREQVNKKAKEIENTIGHVTILVNNAGMVCGNDIIDSKPADMRKTMEVNVFAHFWTIKAFLPHMVKINHGHIVSMSSMVGLLALPGIADYVASKFAVTGLLETLSYEIYAANKYGVHTSSIHPYLVDTDMFEGCSTRFPSLFPPLEQTYVAKRTVEAVLKNRSVVLLPRMMYLFYFLKTVLPVECILVAQKFTGVDRAMDNFHGRKRQNSS